MISSYKLCMSEVSICNEKFAEMVKFKTNKQSDGANKNDWQKQFPVGRHRTDGKSNRNFHNL